VELQADVMVFIDARWADHPVSSPSGSCPHVGQSGASEPTCLLDEASERRSCLLVSGTRRDPRVEVSKQ
jgi:hypothetical protein